MKKFTLFILASLLFFALPYTLNAQCAFNISVEVVNKPCPADCGIKVTLTATTGSIIICDVNNGAQLRIVKMNGTTEVDLGQISIFSNWNCLLEGGINKKVFYGLEGGTYRVYARALCFGTTTGWIQAAAFQNFTITNSYQVPQVGISVARRTMNCRFTGAISVNLSKGEPPYTVTMTTKPAAYTGQTVFTYNAAGLYEIGNLPEGSYAFSTKDNCNSIFNTSAISLGKLPRDIPASTTATTLLRAMSNSNPNASNCGLLMINGVPSMSNWDQDVIWYWQNSQSYYEWVIGFGPTRSNILHYVPPPGHPTVGPSGGSWRLAANHTHATNGKTIENFEIPNVARYRYTPPGGTQATFASYAGFCDSKDSIFLFTKTIGTGCGQVHTLAYSTSGYVCDDGLSTWEVKAMTGTTCDSVKLEATPL